MCSSGAPLPAIELAFTMSVCQLLVFLCGRVLTEGVELAWVVAVERLLAVAAVPSQHHAHSNHRDISKHCGVQD